MTTRTDDADPEILTGLVINPGDRVLITLPGRRGAGSVQRLMDGLTERFPDAEFTIVPEVAMAKIEGTGVAKAIREVLGHVRVQPHSTPIEEVLERIADLIDPAPQEGS